jgi:NAD(P)-dependent dehydrogenase (short-subunit alcohol dehydrogenase family)
MKTASKRRVRRVSGGGRGGRGGRGRSDMKSVREAENRRERSRPSNPLPKQHQEHPGLEVRMKPRPQYKAPLYRGSGKLTGKVALVTGGDSGIGRAVAVLFAREGADVAIMFLPEEDVDAQQTRRAIEAEGRRALLLPGDVTEPGYCRECIDSVVNKLGALDILVNNAAYQENRESIDEITLEQFDQTFKTNIYGYFYLTKFALPKLKRGASIINTGSITGLEGSKHLLDYAATKGAIHAFTKSLAQNLVEKGIRVNCVAPGPVWTPLNTAATESADEVAQFGADTPLERPAQPEEIAPTYVFLASNADSSYITGEVITLLGGETTAG